MLAALADGSFMRFQGYSMPGRIFTFRSIRDFRETLDGVEGRTDASGPFSLPSGFPAGSGA